jgi:hypothetical protein
MSFMDSSEVPNTEDVTREPRQVVLPSFFAGKPMPPAQEFRGAISVLELLETFGQQARARMRYVIHRDDEVILSADDVRWLRECMLQLFPAVQASLESGDDSVQLRRLKNALEGIVSVINDTSVQQDMEEVCSELAIMLKQNYGRVEHLLNNTFQTFSDEEMRTAVITDSRVEKAREDRIAKQEKRGLKYREKPPTANGTGHR